MVNNPDKKPKEVTNFMNGEYKVNYSKRTYERIMKVKKPVVDKILFSPLEREFSLLALTADGMPSDVANMSTESIKHVFELLSWVKKQYKASLKYTIRQARLIARIAPLIQIIQKRKGKPDYALIDALVDVYTQLEIKRELTDNKEWIDSFNLDTSIRENHFKDKKVYDKLIDYSQKILPAEILFEKYKLPEQRTVNNARND